MKIVSRLGVVALLAACSGGSSDPPDNNANQASNSTTGTNNGSTATTGTNNQTTAPNNDTNNATQANNTTVTTAPEPRLRFAGLCATPTATDTADGCTWDWRCAQPLELVCADGSCQCVNNSTPANSFAADTASTCSAAVAEITQTVLDECSWTISYVMPLRCSAGVQTRQMGGCTWEWECNGSTYAVTCEDDRNAGLDCTCVRDGRPTAISFPGGRSSCTGDEADAIANARAGCGWEIRN